MPATVQHGENSSRVESLGEWRPKDPQLVGFKTLNEKAASRES